MKITLLALLFMMASTVLGEIGETQLNSFFRSFETLSSNFIQTTVIDNNDYEPKVSTGTLHIIRPYNFRWHVFSPSEEILLVKNNQIWRYEVDLEQVIYDETYEFNNTISYWFLKIESQSFLEENIITFNDSIGITWVQVVNQIKEYDRVLFGFKNNKLVEMRLMGEVQKVIIKFDNLILNQPIDSKIFELNLPDNVDIIRNKTTD